MRSKYLYLKKLVSDLEDLYLEQGGLFDARARENLQNQIDDLKIRVKNGRTKNINNVQRDTFILMADLLSTLTNIRTLLK